MIAGTIALLTLLFLGGSGDFEYILLSDSDKTFKEVVTDKNLQKRLFAQLKPIRKTIATHKSNIETSIKEVTKMSLEYADQTEAMKLEFDKIMKEFKAAEYKIIEARLVVAKTLPDSTWDDLMEVTEGNFDTRDIPDLETTLMDNFMAMEKAIDENIKDEQRRKRIYTVLEEFKTDLNGTMELLLRESPSSAEIFRDRKADKIALEKAYYSLNSSLTKSLESSGMLYSKARSMALKSEWDPMVSAYKSKAKDK